MGSSPFTSTRKSIQNKFRKGLAARTEIWMILAPLTGTVAQAKKRSAEWSRKKKWELQLTPVEAAHTIVTPRKSNLKGFGMRENDL
jgi:hypothetical protein